MSPRYKVESAIQRERERERERERDANGHSFIHMFSVLKKVLRGIRLSIRVIKFIFRAL